MADYARALRTVAAQDLQVITALEQQRNAAEVARDLCFNGNPQQPILADSPAVTALKAECERTVALNAARADAAVQKAETALKSAQSEAAVLRAQCEVTVALKAAQAEAALQKAVQAETALKSAQSEAVSLKAQREGTVALKAAQAEAALHKAAQAETALKSAQSEAAALKAQCEGSVALKSAQAEAALQRAAQAEAAAAKTEQDCRAVTAQKFVAEAAMRKAVQLEAATAAEAAMHKAAQAEAARKAAQYETAAVQAENELRLVTTQKRAAERRAEERDCALRKDELYWKAWYHINDWYRRQVLPSALELLRQLDNLESTNPIPAGRADRAVIVAESWKSALEASTRTVEVGVPGEEPPLSRTWLKHLDDAGKQFDQFDAFFAKKSDDPGCEQIAYVRDAFWETCQVPALDDGKERAVQKNCVGLRDAWAKPTNPGNFTGGGLLSVVDMLLQRKGVKVRTAEQKRDWAQAVAAARDTLATRMDEMEATQVAHFPTWNFEVSATRFDRLQKPSLPAGPAQPAPLSPVLPTRRGGGPRIPTMRVRLRPSARIHTFKHHTP